MPTNNRISSLPTINALYSTANVQLTGLEQNIEEDGNALFLVTKSGVGSEKIKFKDLKSSIVSNSVSTTGDQVIYGEKTFTDICTFEDTVFLNEIVDTTHTGDISGYNFIGSTGFFDSIGVGSGFANKDKDPEYELDINGNTRIEGQLDVSGEVNFNEGFVSSGEAYIDQLYVTGNNGEWEIVAPKGYDESVHFTTNLNSGERIYEIDFPKTFGSDPIVHATLKNEGGGQILFFNVDNITESSYFITFNTEVPNNNYSIDTQATASADYSLHKTTTQSFRSQIIEGETSYTINYPSAFTKKPTVSVTLERKRSFAVDDPGTAGDSFVDEFEYYLAVQDDTWRRVTMAEVIRTSGSEGDTDFDDDFYYVCIDGTLWGRIPLDPSTKNDSASLGDFDYDNNYIYVFTSEGWKESPVAAWPSEVAPVIISHMISDVTESSFKINFDSTLTSQYFVHSIVSR